MSLYIRPSISRIESVTLKMGERVLANGRSGTRELPFCLVQRTILHPPSARAGFRCIPRSSYPLYSRFLFRAEIFLGRRHSGTPSAKSKKPSSSSWGGRQVVDHPMLLPVCHLALSFHVDMYRPCLTLMRMRFIFIVTSWFHLSLSDERGQHTRHWMGDKWSLRRSEEKEIRRDDK